MSQNGLNFQHISSKEGLTKKDIHSIWPWLSPILWRFEELLLSCVALQSCRVEVADSLQSKSLSHSASVSSRAACGLFPFPCSLRWNTPLHQTPSRRIALLFAARENA